MKGSVQKKGNKYYAVVSQGKINGKYRYSWSAGFDTREEAGEELGSIQEGRIKVSEYLDRWLRKKKTQIALKTYSSYKETIENYVKPQVGHMYLNAVKPENIDNIIDGMLAKPLSPTTAAYMYRVFSSALKDAAEDGIINKNPADFIKPPRKKKNTVKSHDPEVARVLIGKAKEPLKTAIIIAYTTGMRRGEIMALNWEDIQGNKIRVRRSRSDQETKETKSGKPRTIIAFPVLLKHFDTIKREKGYVVVWPDGKSVRPGYISNSFRTLVKKLGMETVRFHDLRHIHATELLIANVHPSIVQERLGHSSISITLDLYSHVLPNIQEGVLRNFNIEID